MAQEKPMISVIVPVYNVEDWIGRCLDSILAQTYTNIEVILINDASCDSSGRICESYASHDGRVQVIHFHKNRGPSAARNAGIYRARGKFVSFIDSDDYAEPDLLEKLYVNLSENGADISVCGAEGIRLEGGPSSTFSRSEAVCCLARGVPFNHVPWGKLYSMELVKKHPFDECYFYSEDLLFLYYVLKDANCVSYLPDRLYHYVNREGSQVHSGVDDRKCTALFVHDRICEDASVHFPEAMSGFRHIALDTNTRLAMLAVEANIPSRELSGYLKRLCQNTRRHFSWKALRHCQEKKVAAAAVLLYAGEMFFRGSAVVYKQIKQWKDRYK